MEKIRVLIVSGGRALKLYSVSLWHLHIILELSLVTDMTRWTRLIYPFFLSLGTHHLVEKVVQKLGSGDWCHYCRWNVAVSSNLGIYECTQSHTQTHRHTSIVIYQSSHICTPIEYKKFAWRPLIPVEFLRICFSFLPFHTGNSLFQKWQMWLSAFLCICWVDESQCI